MTTTWPPVGDGYSLQQLASASSTAASSTPATVSTRFVDTLHQLQELRSTLISISKTGSYAPSAYLKARAFIVLTHGVIEEYLEKICLEVVDGALAAFSVDDKPRTALMALLHYTGVGDIPDAFGGGPWGIRKGLTTGRKVLFHWADANNGIKEKHLLRLLLPTGLKETDMGNQWLSAMSDFGEMRGRVAHYGHANRAQTPVSPNDALGQVQAVTPTLCRIDSKLVALRDE